MKELKRYAIIFILLGLIVFFSLLSPHFFTQQNLTNIFVQQSYVIIAAVGLSFVMISGGMDLSIGYQISVVGVTTAALVKWAGLPFPAALALGLTIGTLLGTLNGLLSVTLKVHTLIVTLGTMTVFQGLSYIISKQSVILNLPPAFKFFGQGYIFGFLPFSVVLMIITVTLAGFILNYTRFGRQVYGIGSNEETARLSGVNVILIRMIVFSICGFFVALASIVLFGRSGSASSSTGPGTEFSAMTSAILGGVSFVGGEGKMWGLVTGVLILGVLSNGMQLIGLNTYVQYIVKGFVLLLAVGFDLLQKKSLAKATIRTPEKKAA
ncbi:MAG: ABC transporter permease [Treponema sp.]|jgi:ribose/xylose/arabinose/galactoside ABC-type transport system permease subunit|nr:ABC transporter permease [Treponema sp.]